MRGQPYWKQNKKKIKYVKKTELDPNNTHNPTDRNNTHNNNNSDPQKYKNKRDWNLKQEERKKKQEIDNNRGGYSVREDQRRGGGGGGGYRDRESGGGGYRDRDRDRDRAHNPHNPHNPQYPQEWKRTTTEEVKDGYNNKYSKYEEKVRVVTKKSKYKDHSGDMAIVTFAFEDFERGQGGADMVNERCLGLTKGLCMGIFECLICQNKIYQKSKIWNCSCCDQAFHLSCIKHWVQKLNNPKEEEKNYLHGEGNIGNIGNRGNRVNMKNSQNIQYRNNSILHWTCPKCNFHFNERWPTYKCFCGVENYPEFHPFKIPHSCGKPCQKSLNTWCKHLPCGLLCHPGPCPKCPVLVDQTCFCGKLSKKIGCSDIGMRFSCEEICGKVLVCGEHTCGNLCHKGECGECKITKTIPCECGNTTRTVPCINNKFQCNDPCGKSLSCGNHKCPRICHSDPCHPCPLSPTNIYTCPCGKMELTLLSATPRSSCLEDIPTCGMGCQQNLPCGMHKCKSMCHMGPCPMCQEKVGQKCRCGGSSRMVECGLVNYSDNTPYICKKVCGQVKSCGKHKCKRKCCEVGSRDPRHLCLLVCDKPLTCKLHICPEFCHLGFCKPCKIFSTQPITCACGESRKEPPIMCGESPPFCPNKCSKELPCGHKCQIPCHPGICGSCSERVQQKCHCGKKLVAHVLCSQGISCGLVCNESLPCGHRCQKVCHTGECFEEEEAKDILVSGCGGKCNMLRVCGHRCQQTCHPNEDCPNEEPCLAEKKVPCECGYRYSKQSCMSTQTIYPHPPLECDAECLKYERNQKIAKAFGSYETENDELHPDYFPESMIQFALHNMPLLTKVEAVLKEIILLENEDGMSLPQMDNQKLTIINNLINSMYNIYIYIYRQLQFIIDILWGRKEQSS